MSISLLFSRPRAASLRALALPFALGVSACASLPADRGFDQVREQAAARGQPWPDRATPGAAAEETERQRMTQDLLKAPLSEAAAVQTAFINNPRLQAEYARLGLGSADLLEAGRLRNPVLSGSVLFPFGGGANRYDLGLTQGLVELLMLPSRSRFADGAFKRAQLEATQQLLTLAADVQQAYYAVVGAQQIVAMRSVIADSAQASADLSSRYKAAGNSTALQLAVDQAAASDAQLALEAAQAQEVATRSALNTLMGLPPQAQWEVTDALPEPVQHEDTLADLQTLAEQKNAALAADRQTVLLYEDSLGVTRRFRLLGDVETGAQFERDDDRKRLLGPSLSLQLPIFNQGQAPILRAQAQLDAARAELKTKQLEIGNGMQLAHARVMAARQRAQRLLTETIPLREAIVARTQEQVNFMLVGVFDGLRGRQDEYAAYQQYLEAVCDYWQARVDLSRIVGSRLPSDAQIGAAVIVPDYAVKPHEDVPAEPMVEPIAEMPGMQMPMVDHTPPPTAPTPHSQHHHGDHP